MKMKLNKKPDSFTLELLVRAKLLLEHAISHSNFSTSIDGMIAIHGLDNSIEYLLRIIIKHLNIETITGKNFDTCSVAGLAGEINKFLKEHFNEQLPYLSEIKMIRQIRNLVQHGIVDPKPDLKRFSKITEKFFSIVLNNIFEITREELRVSTLIENTEVKKHLKLAEEYIDKEEFLLSIVSSRDAFENALFFQIKNSDVKLSSVPALVEAHKSNDKSYWFFEKITNEIELSRLNINLKKYDKFSEYIRYIPSKYNADKSIGYTIINRPWNREDAMFCYSFASEIVIKWQEEESEPIYNPRIYIDSYKDKTKIGDVVISEYLEHGCYYDFGFDSVVELIYVDKLTKQKLGKLVPGKKYLYSSNSYREGKLNCKIKFNIELLNIEKKIITNNPERWEVTLWYNKIPFTWNRKDYKNGRLYKETISINNANEKELHSINENIITKKMAKKIASLRKVIGKICSIEDLKKIDGITDEQINWLSEFTRL